VKIERVESGFFKSNSYLVIDELTGQAMLVDPAGDWKRLAALIASSGAKVVAVVNTHGHYDHASRNHEARRLTGAPIMIHEADAHLFTDFSWPSFFLRRRPRLSPPADRLLRDGDEIEIGSLSFEVIHTPGHTPGGICLRHKKHILTGDTVFAGSVGRTDLKGGSWEQLAASIKDKLFILSDDIHLHPGHGPATTIEDERKYNVFVKLRPDQIEELLFGPPRKKKPKSENETS